MRKSSIIRSVKARFARERWLSILAFLVLLYAWRILEGEPFSYSHYLAVLAALGYLYAISPIPWQWTGDNRHQPPFLQGLLQSVVMNGLLLILVVLWPVLLAPEPLLGADFISKLAQEGHDVTNWGLATMIYGHAIISTILVGGLLSRDEANKLARQEAEATRKDLEAAARQAQTQALQSQLDPHALYNALSGISELIHEDPTKAEKAVLGLSHLYRRMTELGRQECIALGRERELAFEYLDLECLRLGDRLRVRWEWPKELDALEVPPLLLQPLVENAVKHGVAPSEEGGEILLKATIQGGGILILTVADDGMPLESSWQKGTGLSNLEARLMLLGGGSNLRIFQNGSWVTAEVHLKLRNEA